MVRDVDFHLTVITAVVLLLAHFVGVRGMMFASFDEQAARVQGLPVRAINLFLFVSIGVAVSVTTHAIGALSVFGFSVLPAMAALAFSGRVGVVLLLAPAIGMVCGAGGYVLAFLYRFPVGGSQTALACAACLLGMLVSFVRVRA